MGRSRALESLGFAWIQKLETVAASNCYRQAIALQESTGDPRLGARLLYRLALSLAMQGEKDESVRYLRESMVLARSLNDRRIVAHVLSEQALAGCFLGSFAEALSRGQESLAIFQDLNARYQLPNVHLIVANSLLQLGDWQYCRVYAEQSVALISWERQQGFALWAQSLRSAIALATGDYGLARQHGLEAIRLARQTEVRYQNSSAYSVVGLAALLSGDQGEARRYLSESLGYFETGTMLQEMLLALLGVAFFLARQGDEIAAGQGLRCDPALSSDRRLRLLPAGRRPRARGAAGPADAGAACRRGRNARPIRSARPGGGDARQAGGDGLIVPNLLFADLLILPLPVRVRPIPPVQVRRFPELEGLPLRARLVELDPQAGAVGHADSGCPPA